MNRALRTVQAERGGLGAALEALADHQCRSGLVRNELGELERFRLDHPEVSTRYFRAQANPSRALRFQGAGTAVPPPGTRVVNEGCFLCRENIRWQQGGLQLGYELDIRGSEYIAWLNPFPLMPRSWVLARREHVPQGWRLDGDPPGGTALDEMIGDLVALAQALPGWVVFHNGVGAGASIPSHLHFHFFDRVAEGELFPLEAAARVAGLRAHGVVESYPLEALYWRGPGREVVAGAADWIRHWITRSRHPRASLSANVAATCLMSEAPQLYVVPRHKDRSHAPELEGGIGGLEVLGEVPFCTPQEILRLRSGAVDYEAIERILSAVRLPET